MHLKAGVRKTSVSWALVIVFARLLLELFLILLIHWILRFLWGTTPFHGRCHGSMILLLYRIFLDYRIFLMVIRLSKALYAWWHIQLIDDSILFKIFILLAIDIMTVLSHHFTVVTLRDFMIVNSTFANQFCGPSCLYFPAMRFLFWNILLTFLNNKLWFC